MCIRDRAMASTVSAMITENHHVQIVTERRMCVWMNWKSFIFSCIWECLLIPAKMASPCPELPCRDNDQDKGQYSCRSKSLALTGRAIPFSSRHVPSSERLAFSGAFSLESSPMFPTPAYLTGMLQALSSFMVSPPKSPWAPWKIHSASLRSGLI